MNKTHTSNQLTTAINPTGRSPLRRGLVLMVLALASLALLPAARAQSSEMASDSFGQCSAATLNGAYMSEQRGDLNGLPLVQVNRIVADGQGGSPVAGRSSSTASSAPLPL